MFSSLIHPLDKAWKLKNLLRSVLLMSLALFLLLAVSGPVFVSLPNEIVVVELTDKEKHELESSDHSIGENKILTDWQDLHGHTHSENGEEHSHKHSHSSNSTCADHLINKSIDKLIVNISIVRSLSTSSQNMNINSFMNDILRPPINS